MKGKITREPGAPLSQTFGDPMEWGARDRNRKHSPKKKDVVSLRQKVTRKELRIWNEAEIPPIKARTGE